ncbi:hypothetical protein AJ80_06109 [Polytolypa hystricis UAMH7299]|uniref:Uncharacterized protein n=1 Tax=Polytolypa hystricis (strain UAMH7299) TaxID=1447883 RepID=A0A2B7XYG6_POLH7|nr:hypothetical protein AJ80_06109 [Polytolypa hystricis UAMH7299]
MPVGASTFRPLSQQTMRYAEWKGTLPDDSAIDRAKRGDTADPLAKSAYEGLKEKRQSNCVRDTSKSQAITERDQMDSGKRAEAESPKAPKPVIGMSDERGKKGD